MMDHKLCLEAQRASLRALEAVKPAYRRAYVNKTSAHTLRPARLPYSSLEDGRTYLPTDPVVLLKERR